MQDFLNDPELNPERFVVINGMAIERDVLGIATEISRRWPNLRVQYLDPDTTPNIVDAPFQVIERDAKGIDRVFMSVWKLDESVIYHIASRDSHTGFDLDSFLKKQEEKRKAIAAGHWQEMSESAKEIAEGLYASEKDSYTFTDDLTGKKVKVQTNNQITVVKEGEFD